MEKIQPDAEWRDLLWRQFGAAIEMLENSIRACPDELWRAHLWQEKDQPEFAAFWYLAFHALFWLDYYLADAPEKFSPPAPFTMTEADMDGALPDRVYTREELLTYLEYGRERCRARIASAELLAPQRCRPNNPDMTVAELFIYNLRHVHEHAAQLNLFLGQQTGSAPGWVGRTKSEL